MTIAIVLPRAMVFSPKGATSIDLVAKDLLLHSQLKGQTVVYGPDVEEPFEGFDFVGLKASNQRQRDRELVEHLKSQKPSCVVVHQYVQTAELIASKLPNSRVILHRHGLLKKRKNALARFVKSRSYRKLSNIVFVSNFIRGSFLEDFPGLNNRSEVINNGVDTEFWRPLRDKKQQVSYVGRAREDKGILGLIKGFRQANVSDWRLKLVCAVQTQAEHEFFQSVKALIRDSDAIDLVSNYSAEEVRDCLAESLVAISPSIVKEGFPRAVVEAMSCGCATLATLSGGTVEAVGDAAYILEDSNPNTLASAFEELLSDSAWVAELGLEARQHACTALEIRDISRAYDTILRGETP
ncbi:MAG: glycosyltransferase family 4 protein [Cohaesibacter sp.]|nr:glycosyltransferase family 4 protein [Cohaesibacter sp.]MCV6601591.1 glycosyltransferase family 4 protein [Cohaesibacter sp.]